MRPRWDFCNWHHHEHPCFKCQCRQGAIDRDRWERLEGISLAALPWPAQDPAWYDSACASAEHIVCIDNRGTFVHVVAALEFVAAEMVLTAAA